MGVEEVVSGYAGGTVKNPAYREVCSGNTGHAEVVQVTFDADIISFEDLLTLFMASHDPTTLNRQGGDAGTQYRSVIYYSDDEQKATAEKVLSDVAKSFDDPIVTELSPLTSFYAAEVNHQDYYNLNSSAGYCRAVIAPKVKKLRDKFADRLKPEYT